MSDPAAEFGRTASRRHCRRWGTGEGKGRRCRCAGGRVLAPFRESPANVEYLVMGMRELEYVKKEVEGRRNSSADAKPACKWLRCQSSREWEKLMA